MIAAEFAAATIAGLLIYAAIRDAGWQLENEELVGIAPVPAGLVAGAVYGSVIYLVYPRALSLYGGYAPRWAAGGFGMAAGMIAALTVTESFVDAEIPGDRWEPRLLLSAFGRTEY